MTTPSPMRASGAIGPGGRLALLAVGLAVLLVVGSSGQPPTPGERAAETAERLRKAFGPSADWAADVAADLLATRDANNPTTEQDQLGAIDAEIDLLASALLGLEEPDAVVALYGEWYGTGNEAAPMRTPAAVLVRAQAHRLRAWRTFDPPSGAGEVRDGVRAFADANVELAKAVNILEAGTGSLVVGGETANTKASPENLGRWIEEGLPKPRSLGDLKPKPGTSEGVARVRLSGTHAVEYARTFLEWRARLYRELGDLTFRQTGSAFASRSPGGETPQPTALAYYNAAREPLYRARLIAADDPALRIEADLLDERIGWVRGGLGFGGVDFFQFEPYARAGYLRAALGRARDAARTLGKWEEQNRQARATRAKWIEDMKGGKATRAALRSQFDAQATRQLTAAVRGLEARLGDLRTQEGLFEIDRAHREFQAFLGKAQLEAARAQLDQGLTHSLGGLLDEYLAGLQAVERSGGLVLPPPDGDGDRVAADPLAGWPDVARRIDEFAKRLPADGPFADTARLIRERWSVVARPPVAPVRATRYERELELLAAADKDRELHRARLRTFDLKAELPGLRKALESDQDQLDGVQKQLAALPEEIKKAQTELEKKTLDDRLRTTVVPALRRDVERVTGELRKAIGVVKEYQEKLAQLKKLVDDIRNARKAAEDAYEQVVGVIRAAKAIPVTVAAGMATGTMIDTGEAIAQGARAFLDKLVGIAQGKVTAQQLGDAVTAGEKSVLEFLEKAEARERQLREVQAKLQESEVRAEVIKRFTPPDGDLYKEFQQRGQRLRDQAQEVRKVVEQREREVAGKEDEIRGADRLELENLFAQATHRATAAAVQARGVRLETAHLAERLLAQQARIDQVRDALAKSQALAEFIRREAGWREESLNKKVEGFKNESRVRNAEEEKELRKALAEFRAELVRLRQPARRQVTAEAVAAVAPAILVAGGRPQPAERQARLDEANADILRCARWLHALTGDGSLARFAAPCRSLAELRLLVGGGELGDPPGELGKAVAEVAARHDADRGGRRGAFALVLDGDALAELAKGGDRSLRLRTVFDPKGPAAKAWEEAATDAGEAFEYRPASVGDGAATFKLSRPEAEYGVVTGFWILPKFRDGPSAATFPTLRPVGPLRRRVPGGEIALPLKSAADDGADPRLAAPAYTLRNVRAYLNAAGSGSDHLLDPFPPDAVRPPNPRVFGRGIDGGWAFELQGQPAGAGKKLSDLTELRIVFAYLTPGVPPRGSATPARVPDLGFLSLPAGKSGADAAPVAATTEEAKFFGDEWANSPAARRERVARLRAALDGGEPPAFPKREADLGELVRKELDALFDGRRVPAVGPSGDATFDILRPVQVGASVSGARGLLQALMKSVEKEYLEPLKAGVGALADVRTRTAELERFTDALAAQNQRFRQVRSYAEALRRIRDRLAGTDLTPAELARLDELLGEAWDGFALRAVAAELHRDPGDAKRAMILHVLRAIRDERIRIGAR